MNPTLWESRSQYGSGRKERRQKMISHTVAARLCERFLEVGGDLQHRVRLLNLPAPLMVLLLATMRRPTSV